MPAVSREQLVPADSGERDFVRSAHDLRQRPRGNRRVVRQRLVERVHDWLDHVADVGLDVHDRQAHAVAIGKPARQVGLVGSCRVRAMVARGEGMGDVSTVAAGPRGHARHHSGRVQPPRQKRRDRYVAHEVRGDRVVDPLHHLVLHVERCGRGLRREVPVLADRHLAVGAPLQPVAGFELADVAERAGGRRHIAELEVGIERGPVEVAGGQSRGHQRLELRCECDAPWGGDDIQGLDPQAVAREQQGLARRIPDREREHAAQLLHAVGAEVLV